MQIKKEDIMKRILCVSEKLFLTNGYNGTSLNMIASNCYISKSNIYRYFSSKEDIYKALTNLANEKICDAIENLNDGSNVGIYTISKIEMISLVLTDLIFKYRTGILIILRSGSRKDSRLIIDKITNSFVSICPVGDEYIKYMIVKLMISGLTDIAEDYTSKDDLLQKVRGLLYYHYRGLKGVYEEYEKQ